MAGHIKVTGGGQVWARFTIEDTPDGERKARDAAARVIEMRKSPRGNKGDGSPSSKIDYRIEVDPAPYPFSKI